MQTYTHQTVMSYNTARGRAMRLRPDKSSIDDELLLRVANTNTSKVFVYMRNERTGHYSVLSLGPVEDNGLRQAFWMAWRGEATVQVTQLTAWPVAPYVLIEELNYWLVAKRQSVLISNQGLGNPTTQLELWHPPQYASYMDYDSYDGAEDVRQSRRTSMLSYDEAANELERLQTGQPSRDPLPADYHTYTLGRWRPLLLYHALRRSVNASARRALAIAPVTAPHDSVLEALKRDRFYVQPKYQPDGTQLTHTYSPLRVVYENYTYVLTLFEDEHTTTSVSKRSHERLVRIAGVPPQPWYSAYYVQALVQQLATNAVAWRVAALELPEGKVRRSYIEGRLRSLQPRVDILTQDALDATRLDSIDATTLWTIRVAMRTCNDERGLPVACLPPSTTDTAEIPRKIQHTRQRAELALGSYNPGETLIDVLKTTFDSRIGHLRSRAPIYVPEQQQQQQQQQPEETWSDENLYFIHSVRK